jgi:hypothetical protein
VSVNDYSLNRLHQNLGPDFARRGTFDVQLRRMRQVPPLD